MRDGILTRQQLKGLMVRSDRPGLIHLGLFLCVFAMTGTLVWMTMGSRWVLPAMFLHGIVLVHHFSLQHECCHYTPFRNRWLNELAGHYCGFLLIIPNRFFRYEHCDHHTYTNLHGRDPELIELPISLGTYLLYISGVPYWRAKFSELVRHAFGSLSADEQRFVPRQEHSAIVREARLYSALYGVILLASVLSGWWGLLFLWWIPMFISEPVMRAIRMTEHVGRPNITDMRENTRTNLSSRPLRFLCWNMNYHAEHHYAPSVPFHALPRLHRILEGHVHVESRGYLGAHIDILRQILQNRKTRNPKTVGANAKL